MKISEIRRLSAFIREGMFRPYEVVEFLTNKFGQENWMTQVVRNHLLTHGITEDMLPKMII
jgi:hypothetical protein